MAETEPAEVFPMLPSPERFAKQQVFDAYRAEIAERRKAEAEAHSARMLAEADAAWSDTANRAAAVAASS